MKKHTISDDEDTAELEVIELSLVDDDREPSFDPRNSSVTLPALNEERMRDLDAHKALKKTK